LPFDFAVWITRHANKIGEMALVKFGPEDLFDGARRNRRGITDGRCAQRFVGAPRFLAGEGPWVDGGGWTSPSVPGGGRSEDARAPPTLFGVARIGAVIGDGRL
jgi:hypothetical protein